MDRLSESFAFRQIARKTITLLDFHWAHGGGGSFTHHFPQSGEYEVQVRLMRDRDENIEGLHEKHHIDVLIDRQRRHRFTVKPPKTKKGWQRDDTLIDANLKKRINVKAGPHDVAVTFPKKSDSLLEIGRQPFVPSFNRHRHPRQHPAIYEVSILGPFDSEGPGDTPSRRQILTDVPENAEDSAEAKKCAKRILSRLARLAYRRPVDEDDVLVPMTFFVRAFQNDGFEAGIESAVAAILVNPNFLLRAEFPDREQPGVGPTSPQVISDLHLASRLSFFLWSSIPDDELLNCAENNQLREPDMLRNQVTRMLHDERSQSLVDNFASQWLYLRNLANFHPDRRLYPDFDDNLREAMRRETSMCFEHVVRRDESVLTLISSDSTFLNERLAIHYGIPGVLGSHFRRVDVAPESNRGGILRHASIHAVTSYATRTSPTVRGNWILENILGIPSAPPPPDVPSLPEQTQSTATTVRERLATHRQNPACASCHDLIDPIGFSLENFDAVGRWRHRESDQIIDSSGRLPDGSLVTSVAELEQGILQRPEMFVGTMTEKLMTFALGRGIESGDLPAIRKIVRESAEDSYRFSTLIHGIVKSMPFQMRATK